MVDLAIAANFVRELTEEQFAEPRQNAGRQRQNAGRQRQNAGRHPANERRAANGGAAPLFPANRSATAANESGPEDATGKRGTRDEATRLRRTLARLAQVRG
jgi:hypothetical protein